MNYYHVWCNLKESHKDLEFASNLRAYLGMLQSTGKIESFSLARRKFGFSPPELGDFHVVIVTKDLEQLDSAFNVVAAREGKMESLHAGVYSMVTDLRTALYRDFPDPQRA